MRKWIAVYELMKSLFDLDFKLHRKRYLFWHNFSKAVVISRCKYQQLKQHWECGCYWNTFSKDSAFIQGRVAKQLVKLFVMICHLNNFRWDVTFFLFVRSFVRMRMKKYISVNEFPSVNTFGAPFFILYANSLSSSSVQLMLLLDKCM